MKTVISLSGYFITENLKNNKLKEYVKVFKEMKEKCEKLVVVVGAGGRKDYIKASKGFKVSEAKKDLIGIQATRLNALLLNYLLGKNAYPEVPESIEEVEMCLESGKIITMGGTEPGHSTDAVAALVGEIINANLFINATTVEAIFDKNPKEHKNVKKLDEVSYEELLDIISEEENEAGSYSLIDHTAAEIIKRAGLKTVVINGSDPEEILKAMEGKSSGSIIK